jgi:hypothetical protein
MTDTSKKWARRVAKWRASGLTSTAFCAGRGFTAGGLRYWAHVLRKQEAESRGGPSPAVRLARVVRTPAGPPSAGSAPAGQCRQNGASSVAAGAPAPSLVLYTQGVRIGVPSGFDSSTLAAVLDVLDRRSLGGTR